MANGNTSPQLFFFREVLVLWDRHAADLFGVSVKAMNQQVKRNAEKFAEAYSFRLSAEETKLLRSQLVASDIDVSRIRTPRVFTEEGVIMLATVLKSQRAVDATKLVVRTFVEVQRQMTDRQNALIPAQVTETGTVAEAVARDALPSTLSRKIEKLIDRLATVTLTQAQQDAVLSEAKQFRDEGLRSLHAIIEGPAMRSAEQAAQIKKLLAEANKLEAERLTIIAENRERERLALIRDLRFQIDCYRALQSGSLETFSRILAKLDGGS